ncbi:hypothetical protein HDU93_004958 [Gonapodya sp. JEL0774]|nr:hypothetical protein HDU93_004958 [Gonapodya sp. JEL0774]
MPFIGLIEVLKVSAVFVVGLFVFIPFAAYIALGAKRIAAFCEGLRASDPKTTESYRADSVNDRIPFSNKGDRMQAVPEQDITEPLLVLPTPVWPPPPGAASELEIESDEEEEGMTTVGGEESMLRKWNGSHLFFAFWFGMEASPRRPSKVSQFFEAFPTSRDPPSFDFDHPVSEIVDETLSAHSAPSLIRASSKEVLESDRGAGDASSALQPDPVRNSGIPRKSIDPSGNTVISNHAIAVKRGSSRPLTVHVFTFVAIFLVSLSIYAAKGIVTPALLSWNILAYFLGMYLPDRFKKVFHPLLTCVVLTWAGIAALGAVTAIKLYSNGFKYLLFFSPPADTPRSLPGAGDVLLSMLDASVVALAFKMYEHRLLLAKRGFEIIFTVATISFCAIWFHVLFSRLLGLNKFIALAMGPRFVTTPLAIQAATSLGAQSSLSATLVVLTGILGAIVGPSILKISRVDMSDSLLVGLATGSTSHGIGTSSLLVSFPDAAAVSSVAFLLSGVLTVALTKVPPLQAALIAAAGV